MSLLLKILYMLLQLFFILHTNSIISMLIGRKKMNSCKLLAMKRLWKTWVTKYRTTSTDTPKSPSSKRLSLDIFDRFFTLDNAIELELKQVITGDEYIQYCTKPYDSFLSTFPPLQWWLQHETEYPEPTQRALDVHSIPATSAECERVFLQQDSYLLRGEIAY